MYHVNVYSMYKRDVSFHVFLLRTFKTVTDPILNSY